MGNLLGGKRLVRRSGLLEQAWIWSVVGYTLLRFVIAWAAFGDHGVSVWTFGAIDVLTAWPYAKAVSLVCRRSAHAEWDKLALPTAIAASMFMAPYAYLWLAAPAMPLHVRSGMIVFIVVMAMAIAVGVVRRVRRLQIDYLSTVDVDLRDERVGATEPERLASTSVAAATTSCDGELTIDVRDKALRTPASTSSTSAKKKVRTTRLVVGRFDDEGIRPARIMQAEVYRERGFYHESQRFDDFGALIDDWSRQSIHFALYLGDDPIGHARVIAPGPVQIPVRTCFGLDTDVPDTWEWSAHAKANDAPRWTHAELARHVLSFLTHNDVYRVAMVCEPALERLIERSSGTSPFVRLGPDQHVWGGINGPMLFLGDRAGPKEHAYYTSSHEAHIRIDEFLPEQPIATSI